MTTIYKYLLQLTDYQEIEMPSGARILSVIDKNNALCLYAKVWVEATLEVRQIHIFGAGNPIPEMTKLIFIGTVQIGARVWHTFEEPRA
jgi:hypothetical protein